jgi:D-glycero-alpha-D-manno-heptose 1-phosphate guanylyltransferase
VSGTPLSASEVTAVILAGGLGTRIQHLLPGLPKPLAPVCGRPFLEWAVCYLGRQGVRRVVLATGHLAEKVEEHFAAQPVRGVRVACVRETQPLGTAGGFLNAVRGVADRSVAWLVLNGDSLALAPLTPLFDAAGREGFPGAILGVAMPDASRYGTIERDATGALAGFREKQAGAGVISAGVYVFRSELVAEFPPATPLSFEKDVFPAWSARRVRLKVCVADAPFLDVGTPESLPLAEKFVRDHPEFFQAG